MITFYRMAQSPYKNEGDLIEIKELKYGISIVSCMYSYHKYFLLKSFDKYIRPSYILGTVQHNVIVPCFVIACFPPEFLL